MIEKKLSRGDFQTFKILCDSHSIIERHEEEALKHESSFLEPKLTYLPCLLMDVKYTKGGKTCEGPLLWSLTDGEMVRDVSKWETTKGFEDCLKAKVDEGELRVLKVLIESGGTLEKEKLLHLFPGKVKEIERSIESCCQKKLMAKGEKSLRLHFENPKLATEPTTIFSESLVCRSKKNQQIEDKKYSVSEIEKFAHLIFGKEFAIRNTRIVYLPVHVITIENKKDGSFVETHWNALNGKRIEVN